VGVAISCNDIGDAVSFYRDKLGFAQYRRDPTFSRLTNAFFKAAGVDNLRVRRASQRRYRAQSFTIAFIEFKRCRAKAVFPEVHDRGATIAAHECRGYAHRHEESPETPGFPINSRTGEPYNNVVIVKAPDALFLQLRQAPPV
jgi:catechol 2,3-dioxygenase-like lactoylglutathione lyase family enzyme